MQSQVHGGDIYSAEYSNDFSISTSPLGMPDGVRKAYIESANTLSQYPDVRCRELRTVISKEFLIPKEWIVCSAGAAELIYAVANAIRPRSGLVIAPSFSEYETALRLSGCTDIRFYTCREESGFLIGEDILDLITDDLDLFDLCNPNNPTGVLVSFELMLEIVERCRQKHVLLVLDECYVGLLRYPKQVTMLRRLEGNDYLFILNAFTKLYSVPGLRLGVGVTSSRPLLEKVRSCMQPWNVSSAAQACGIAALRDKAYVHRVRETVQEEMDFLKSSFDRIGITWYGSSSNFMFFRGPEDLFDRCAAEGILIRDCSNYRGLEPGYFRVSCRMRRDNEKLCGILAGIYAEEDYRLRKQK